MSKFFSNKFFSVVATSSAIFVGVAHADMSRYQSCVGQYAGGGATHVANPADLLAGVLTYETYRVFGGGTQERPVHEQIRQNCVQHLSDVDEGTLIQQVGEVLRQRNRLAKASPAEVTDKSLQLLDQVTRVREAAPVVTSATVLTTPSVQRTINKGQSVNSGFVDSMSLQFIEVLKNTVGSVSSAFMVFQATGNDPTSQVCTSDPILGTTCSYTRHTYDMASGDIPGTDLAVGTNSAHLITDVANNPNMNFSHCVGDDIAGTTTCTDVPPTGVFDVTFAKTSTNYYKYNGVVETKTGPQIVRTSGNQQQYSARAAGTMAGWPVGATADSTFGLSTTDTVITTTQ